MAEQHTSPGFGPAVIALPAIYLLLLAVTVLSSSRPDSFQRIDGSDPVAAMMLMLSENLLLIVAVYAVTGTLWWYLVGFTARSASGRVSATVAALFSLFTFSVATLITLEKFRDEPDRALLPFSALLQYGLLALLCLGAFIAALCASRTMLRRDTQTNTRPAEHL